MAGESRVSELILRLRDEVSVAAKASTASLEHLNRAVDQTIASAAKSSQAMFRFKGAWEPSPQLRLAREEIQLLNPQFIGFSGAAAKAAVEQEKFLTKTARMTPIIAATVREFSGMSRGATLVSGGLTTLIFAGLTPVGVALAAGAVALGAWSDASAKADEKSKALQEIQKAFAADLKASSDRVRELKTATEQMGTDRSQQIDIQKRNALLNIEQRLAGQLASPGFRDEDEGAFLRREAARNAATRERAAVEASAAKRLSEILKDELATISRMDAVAATNTLVRKQNALAAAEQAGQSAAVTSALLQEISVAEQRIRQIDSTEKAARGGDLAGVFGAEVGQIRKQAGDIFKAGGQVDEATLQRLFSQFQAIKDISQQKFGFDVPADLAGKLADTENRLQTIAQKANINLTVDLLDAGRKFSEIEQQLRAIGEGANLKFNVDTLAAIGQLDDLRAKASVPIVQEVKVVTSGSPTLPFSEYFQRYAPGVLDEFSRKAQGTLTLDTNFSQAIFGALDSIANAKTFLTQQAGSRSGLHPSFGAAIQTRLLESQNILNFLLSAGLRPIESGGGGSDGGGGNITLNIDLSDSIVTADAVGAIKRDLVPAIEESVRMASGKSLGTRVLS